METCKVSNYRVGMKLDLVVYMEVSIDQVTDWVYLYAHRDNHKGWTLMA